MSKFEFDTFYNEEEWHDVVAVSREKYSKEEAVEIAREVLADGEPLVFVKEGYVRFRTGRANNGEIVVGWWLEDEAKTRCCPCWVLHVGEQEQCSREYEVFALEQSSQIAS